MTVADKLGSQTHTIFNMILDREPVNYAEASSLYAIITQGYFNIAALEVMHNQAQDPELKDIIKRAIKEQTEPIMKHASKLLAAGDGQLPADQKLPSRQLHDEVMALPHDAALTDPEIVALLSMMGRVSQQALLLSMQNTYQPEIALMFRKQLDSGLDFNYQLMQLTLKHGWLPHVAKLEH